uniref:Uncharacterized protein n=2 Tax=Avena sativa TaxID=4498 RepID=A0ACD5Z422_AVESA
MSSTEASSIPFRTIKTITDDFSDTKKIGSGGYGEVYRGLLNGDEVAVKKLFPVNDIVDVDFNNEFSNLMKVQHKNIVRLLHYCYEKAHKHTEQNGQYFFSEEITHLSASDPFVVVLFRVFISRNNGHQRERSKQTTTRAKPENLLMDERMVPKIADFGLARLFGEKATHIMTQNVMGSYGYIAPEYRYSGQVSLQADIYSLGILIMEITTGEKNISNDKDLPGMQYIENVRQIWTEEHIVSKYPKLDGTRFHEVKTCIKIGVECVKLQRKERPAINEIVEWLNGTRNGF